MNVCLKCQKEYNEDVEKCPECNVYLVDGPFDFSDMEPTRLYNVGDMIERSAILSLLSSVGINAFTSEDPTGTAAKLYVGGDRFFGEDIFVPKCMLEISQQLLEAPEAEIEEYIE